MFPSDDILIARGKFSTLSKMRREQIERVQGICTTMVTTSQAILRDCEQKPPVNGANLETMRKCIDNVTDARERLITLCLGLSELEPEAWGKE